MDLVQILNILVLNRSYSGNKFETLCPKINISSIYPSLQLVASDKHAN